MADEKVILDPNKAPFPTKVAETPEKPKEQKPKRQKTAKSQKPKEPKQPQPESAQFPAESKVNKWAFV